MSDMIFPRKGTVSSHDFPKKGHSTMIHIPWICSLYLQEQILRYWPLRRYNLWGQLYKSYPGTGKSHAGISHQYRSIWWHWYNSLTPRHMNLVNGHGQKQKRCSEPVSSGYLSHTPSSVSGSRGRLIEEHRVRWKALSGAQWDFTAELLWCYCKSWTLLLLFHSKILFPNVNKLASTLGSRGLIKRKVRGKYSLLLNCFQS